MTAKHTLGPWKFDGGEYVEATDSRICLMCFPDTARTDKELDKEMEIVEADARLIAAAPELLEAAKTVEEAWAGNGDMSRAVDACLLAIAKAEGRVP